jgi:hypothetical protein
VVPAVVVAARTLFGDEQDQEGDEVREDLELFEEFFRTIVGAGQLPGRRIDPARSRRSYLLVTQTYENHKKIEHFLRTSPGPFAGPGGSGKWQAAV